MEGDQESGDVKIRPLGGVNQRNSPIDLPPSEFSEVKGLFPSQNGLLERIKGNKFLTKFNEAILSISPTYNTAGHLVIQTATKRYLTTLDELFNRNSYTSDLTPASSSPGGEILEEETMSLAIIIGKKAVNTPGQLIPLIFIDNRDLSDIILNEGGIVTGLSSNVFTLAAGSYRIRSHCCYCAGAADLGTQLFIHRLYNSTNSDYLFKVVGVVSAASTGMPCSTPARIANDVENIWTDHIGAVTLTAPCDISAQSRVNIITVPPSLEGRPVNLGENEIYTVIEILKTA